MIEVSEMVSAKPGQVFAVLADGWLYPLWVVGASHMRQVDEGWPAVGTRIHHSVSPWPLPLPPRGATRPPASTVTAPRVGDGHWATALCP